jgi:hypothetical protein
VKKEYETSLALLLARVIEILERNAGCLGRSADALERIAAAAERAPVPTSVIPEMPRARRKKVAASAERGSEATPAEAPINVDDPEALRVRALEQIRQKITEALDAGVPATDIEEVVSDIAGSADPATLGLPELSKIIGELIRVTKRHNAPPEESESDKATRAGALETIRTLFNDVATDNDRLTTLNTVLRSHTAGGDIDRLDLATLRTLVTALRTDTNSAKAAHP